MLRLRRLISGRAFTLNCIRANLGSTHFALALALLVGLGVRAFPEVLAGKYPLGFDTVSAYLTSLFAADVFSTGVGTLFKSPGLFLVLQGIVFRITGDAYLTLKILPVAIFGFFTLSIFLYSTKSLALSPRWSLTTAFLSSVSLLSLRLSWDLQKNMLGVPLGIAALAALSCNSTRAKLLSVPLSIAAIWSHWLVGVFLIGVLFSRVVISKATGKQFDRYASVSMVLAAPLLYYESLMPNGTVWIPGFLSSSGFGFSETVWGALYFTLCGGPLLLLTVFVKRDRLAKVPLEIFVWTFMSVGFGLLGPMVGFNTAPPYRIWLMMAFPSPIFATIGLMGLELRFHRGRDWSRVILGGLAVWAFIFLSVSPATFPVGAWGRLVNYGPSGYQQNVVPVNQVSDLTAQMQKGEALAISTHHFFVVPQQFWGLALASQVDSPSVIQGRVVGNYLANSTLTNFSNEMSIDGTLTIWWNQPNGWYNVYSIPASFEAVSIGKYFSVYAVSAPSN